MDRFKCKLLLCFTRRVESVGVQIATILHIWGYETPDRVSSDIKVFDFSKQSGLSEANALSIPDTLWYCDISTPMYISLPYRLMQSLYRFGKCIRCGKLIMGFVATAPLPLRHGRPSRRCLAVISRIKEDRYTRLTIGVSHYVGKRMRLIERAPIPW